MLLQIEVQIELQVESVPMEEASAAEMGPLARAFAAAATEALVKVAGSPVVLRWVEGAAPGKLVTVAGSLVVLCMVDGAASVFGP